MNEETLFTEALKIESEKARQQFLATACGDNTELKQAVEKLLTLAKDAGSFLEHAPPGLTTNGNGGGDATIMHGRVDVTNHDLTSIESPDRQSTSTENDHNSFLNYLKPSTREGSLGKLGHYEILDVVGKGAFGTVLRAFDEKLERIVAIKVLAPELAATSPARKRFLREARTSAAIRHENVVGIHAVEDEPIPYLVMEFIPGNTLQGRLDKQGPLDLRYVLQLGKQIADGLAAAHEQGLVHRDIKPGNILLEGGVTDRVKITDFGLARTVDDASMTQSGTIAGTPMYMAPEQVLGQKLDQRADLFSLGSVLYQMLSGRPPFRAATTMAVLKRVTDEAPRPIQEIIPEVPAWMCEIIRHLHAKNPMERYGTAQEVSKLLANCLSDVEAGKVPKIPAPIPSHTAEPISPFAENLSQNSKPPRKWQRSPLASFAIAGAILLTVLGLTEATDVTHITSTVIRLANGFGTLVIESDDPTLQISVDGEVVSIQSGNAEAITLHPGQHGVSVLKDGKEVKQELVSITRNGRTVLKIRQELSTTNENQAVKSADSKWHGWTADAPPPAISPFDSKLAEAHQVAWAKYLGVPFEFVNSVGMKFRLIPPGEFTMGSTPEQVEQSLREIDDPNGRSLVLSERPQHRVTITRPFYLGTFEVTQQQYQVVTKENPAYFSSEGNGKETVAEIITQQLPVEQVSWADAVDFCQTLSQLEKMDSAYQIEGEGDNRLHRRVASDGGYYIPTEAQWEFACRAGTQTSYWSGETEQDMLRVGWFGKNSRGRTHAVGELAPNPFGLYDVHGNVWEWCEDWWSPTYYSNFQDRQAIDPSGPELSTSTRIVRSGPWFHTGTFFRSSYHFAYPPFAFTNDIGFRVAVSIEGAKRYLQSHDSPPHISESP